MHGGLSDTSCSVSIFQLQRFVDLSNLYGVWRRNYTFHVLQQYFPLGIQPKLRIQVGAILRRQVLPHSIFPVGLGSLQLFVILRLWSPHYLLYEVFTEFVGRHVAVLGEDGVSQRGDFTCVVSFYYVLNFVDLNLRWIPILAVLLCLAAL